MFLFFAGLVWLWQGGKVEERSQEVVKSSRAMSDRDWRGKSDREMTLAEMEGFVGKLSDDELRVELDRDFEDWLARNEERQWFSTPRLAVMLTREIGKRDGEAGMREVARWLNFEGDEGAEDPWEDQKQFFGMRVLTASFGGWVSEDPEHAISRLIESRKNEWMNEKEDWPLLNEGFVMYFKTEAFFAMERVLRDGFERLAEQDLPKAKELLLAGTAVWAFDTNEVLEGVFQHMEESERLAFFNVDHDTEALIKIDPLLSRGDPFLFEERVNRDLWSGAYADHLISDKLGAVNAKLDLLARVRPEDAKRVLLDPRTNSDIKERLFAFMVSGDSAQYSLLGELPEGSLMGAMNLLLEGSRVLSFGPIDGREDSWKIDYPELERAVKNLEVGDEKRRQLLDGVRLFRELE